jgi:LmbE family N-acetylglucosaminyl deacetylase
MPRAVALSPHLDDAVFSCGGTLARLAQAGWAVTVVTAFTRSVAAPTGFALACQLDKGLPAEADYMAIRRTEDAEACACIDAMPLWLDLAEAPHRGYECVAALFGPPRRDDPVQATLADALIHALIPAPELILAPQAIGGHVDHVLLHEAVRAVLPPGVPVWWWRDVPYASRPAAQPFGETMARLPERAEAGDVAARLAAAAAYASQIGFQFGGVEQLAAALHQAGRIERFREQRRV